jgi:predicted DNA-binding transcriptional regulator YafY
MGMASYRTKIKMLDQMIVAGNTGTPRECAEKMGMSERSLYSLISQMKSALRTPIEYCRERQTYYYSRPGYLRMCFVPDAKN